jgi:hypothetical protein
MQYLVILIEDQLRAQCDGWNETNRFCREYVKYVTFKRRLMSDWFAIHIRVLVINEWISEPSSSSTTFPTASRGAVEANHTASG